MAGGILDFHRARALGASLAACALAGCTVVNVDGPASVTRTYPGVLRILPAEDASTVAYTARGFGLVPGRNGATLGFARETVVAVSDPEECRLILIEPDEEEAGRIAELLGQAVEDGQICRGG